MPISFDAMIQRMGRAVKKEDNTMFVFLMAKWTKIEDPKELEDRVAKRGRSARSHAHKLSDTNQPKLMHNPNPLNQAVIADDGFSDVESCIGDSNDEFDQGNNDIFTDLLNTKVNDGSYNRKSKKQISKFDTAK